MAKKVKQTLEDSYPIYELPEVEVTAEPYYKKFLNGLPQPVQQYLQSEANNAILARQVGSIDNPSYKTISKEDVERNKRNYFDVQSLNTAMGSPYVMNQNSFNYNPNIANQQLQYGANYPISTIENAFEMGLEDAALNYALKGVPIALDKLGLKDYAADIENPKETIKAIRDGRYTPLFLTKSRAKTAFIKNQKRLQNTFDDAYEFNKQIELHKVQPEDIEKLYKSHIDNLPNFMKTDEVLNSSAKPKLHIDPLKNKPGQKFFNANGYNDGSVVIPSRTSKHILTDPNSNKIKQVLSHEVNHTMQDIIPRYRDIVTTDYYNRYGKVNELNDLANKVFAPIKKNSLKKETIWHGNPREVQSEVAGLQYRLNNFANYSNQPQKNKDFIKDYIHKRFFISKDEADEMLTNMSRYSFALGGHINTKIKYKNGDNSQNYNYWLKSIANMRGWNANEMNNDLTYDYNLFYNRQPKEAKAMLNRDSNAHFTDIGKTSLHPTFSDESYYSGRKSSRNPRGIIGGHWNNSGNRYTLSKSQIDNNWNIRNTIDYLSSAEPNGVEVRMPNGTRPYIDDAYFEKVLPQVNIIAKRKRK